MSDRASDDLNRARVRELAARANLDALAVRVLETYLDAIYLDRDEILELVGALVEHARGFRKLETLNPDRDELAQRATSLESTVRVAHREAVEIVEELRTYGDETSYSRDRIEERASRVARMTHSILTGRTDLYPEPDEDDDHE